MARPDTTPSDTAAYQRREKRLRRAQRIAAASFLIAVGTAAALLVVYALGGQTQVEGALIFLGFGAVGVGLGVWVKVIVGPQEVVEERYPMRSPEQEREAFQQEYESSLGEAAAGGRRRFLLRLLTGAGASLGLALLIPLRSLGPGPENELFETDWEQGRRLVTPEGEPLKASDVIPDQAVTVFPEGSVGSADSQAILIGLRPDEQTADIAAETVSNLVCYSKICTHAGCPVGLYRAAAGELLCPCHQSTFNVYRGATVVSGPAGRPLPQLPIGTDGEGYLVALGEFTAPVGPSFWNLTDDVERGEA